MCDSAATCMYLADRYAPGLLAPAVDDPDRGPFLQWMIFATGVLFQRFKLFRDYPTLSDYISRCGRREAFLRALAVDKAGPRSLPARVLALAMGAAASIVWARKPTYWLLDRLRCPGP